MTKTLAVNIQISTGDSKPIFRQIVDGIMMEIVSGNLPVGGKIPSVRGLAMQLMVNANTVAKAYSELTSQGLVEPHQGLGLFVAKPREVLSEEEKEKRLNQALKNFVMEIVNLSMEEDKIVDGLKKEISKLKKNNNN
jgi:GntR family transcriptional regulator